MRIEEQRANCAEFRGWIKKHSIETDEAFSTQNSTPSHHDYTSGIYKSCLAPFVSVSPVTLGLGKFAGKKKVSFLVVIVISPPNHIGPTMVFTAYVRRSPSSHNRCGSTAPNSPMPYRLMYYVALEAGTRMAAFVYPPHLLPSIVFSVNSHRSPPKMGSFGLRLCSLAYSNRGAHGW